MGDFFQQLDFHSLWLFGSLCLCFLGTNTIVSAQIIPDETLPQNSQVTSNGKTLAIDGGTRVGGNLFHSFSEFSVPTGTEAFFNNPLNIQNILSRVTGVNISNIDGLIRTNGSTNLFLINPNGIIFGPNAQLNIGGSFIGSTANSIKFADGSEFSATNPQAPPLLLINVPSGLQFGSNPGSIINQSQAPTLIPLPPLNTPLPIPNDVGLQVRLGRTLALIGGDLNLESGNLTAFQGEIHLGSVASPGLVTFEPTATGLAFDYTGIQNFGNIELSGTSSVIASGLGGGAIFVKGGNVTLRDRATVRSDTVGNFNGRGIDIQAAQFKLQDLAFVSSSSVGGGKGGDITLDATDAVELKGTGFDNFRETYVDAALNGTVKLSDQESGLFTGTLGAGSSGNITIDTRQLTLREGAVILSPTFGAGAGGNITINASELVDVSGSGVLTTALDQGNAGSLTIDTRKLMIRDEATVTTATFFGAGNSGDILVRASDSVTLSEFKEETPIGTNFSTTTVGGKGIAGNLEISTRALLVEGGATISSTSGLAGSPLITSEGKGGDITINASDSVTVTGTSLATQPSRSQIVTATLGSADSGILTINTKTLLIQDGGGVGASTVGSGRGGDVFINASESVEVNGRTRDRVSFSGLATASGDLLLSSFYPGQLNPTGAAGNLNVNTGKLTVRDGGSVNVQSFGSGNAGTIKVVADAIALDSEGSIDATTVSGEGGNLILESRDILLRRGSRIRTDAGNTQGGNITINTDTLVAVPIENSDITANAQEGSGGRVSITAQGIFGTEFREKLTPESDITATSDLGPQFNGTVQIDIQGINPSRGLVELPGTVVDSSQLIATGCPVDKGNSFAITGRGGLPEDPTQTLRGRTVWQDLRLAGGTTGTGDQARISQSQSLEQNQQLRTKNQQPASLIEATGWMINADGQVELVAYAPKVTPQSPWYTLANCGDMK